MNSPDIAAVAGRVATLERQNKRLRAGLVALAAVGALGLLAGAGDAPPSKIVAQRITIVDAAGRERAVLGWFDENKNSKNGNAALLLLDSKGAPRMVMDSSDVMGSVEISDVMGSVEIYDNNETERVNMFFVDGTDAQAQLAITGPNGSECRLYADDRYSEVVAKQGKVSATITRGKFTSFHGDKVAWSSSKH